MKEKFVKCTSWMVVIKLKYLFFLLSPLIACPLCNIKFKILSEINCMHRAGKSWGFLQADIVAWKYGNDTVDRSSKKV